MSLTPGTLLGPYEIQSQLGTGGMGKVYKAQDDDEEDDLEEDEDNGTEEEDDEEEDDEEEDEDYQPGRSPGWSD